MRVTFGQGLIIFELDEMNFQDIITFFINFIKDDDIDHVQFLVDGKPINLKGTADEAINKISKIKVQELRMNCRYISEKIYFITEIKDKSNLRLVMDEDLNYLSNDLKKKIKQYIP